MSLYTWRLIDATGPDAQGNYTINLPDGSTKKLPGSIFEALLEPYVAPPTPDVPPVVHIGPSE